METNSTVEKLVDVCPLIANCVTEFETVFRGRIFWRFSFITPNKNARQKCFTVYIPDVDLLSCVYSYKLLYFSLLVSEPDLLPKNLSVP